MTMEMANRSLLLLSENADTGLVESKRVELEDNTFGCVVFLSRSEDDICLKAVFALNGKRLEAQFTMHEQFYNREAAVRGLRDEIAREIASQIIVTAMDALHHDHFVR